MILDVVTFKPLRNNFMLDAKPKLVQGRVEDVPDDQFLLSTDDQVIEFVNADRFEPIDVSQFVVDAQDCEARQYGSGISGVTKIDRNGQFYSSMQKLVVYSQLTGSAWLLDGLSENYQCGLLKIEVVCLRNGSDLKIKFEIIAPLDESNETLVLHFERCKASIIALIAVTNKALLASNNSTVAVAKKTIADKRERLSRRAQLIVTLNLPLTLNSNAPSLSPIMIEPRRELILPVVPGSGLQREPGLSSKTYNLILDVIRHQCATFEQAPETYLKLGEDDLRNVLCANLNSYFKGGAGAEVFRRRGKTDILILDKDRSAFVGECKFWSGPANVSKAVDQLLDYLTWRDCNASLIFFNRNVRGFTRILKQLPTAVRGHRFFLRDLEAQSAGEWRFEMRSKEDPGRRVTVHVFAVDLFVVNKPKGSTKSTSIPASTPISSGKTRPTSPNN
jgi:hypothetical protein